jgi:hypothetical protein
MNPTFIKVMLLLIALFLGILALRLFLQPEPAFANPDGKFGNVQFSAVYWNVKYFYFFDSKTGDIWQYDESGKECERIGRLVELGKPMQGGK